MGFQGISYYVDMGNCQNYGPFLGPYYNTGPNTGPNLGDPKRDHNFDNPPYRGFYSEYYMDSCLQPLLASSRQWEDGGEEDKP